jgi:hypothetical protein
VLVIIFDVEEYDAELQYCLEAARESASRESLRMGLLTD